MELCCNCLENKECTKVNLHVLKDVDICKECLQLVTDLNLVQKEYK